MYTIALEMIHPAFTKGFMTAGKPEYKYVAFRNDAELIVLARDLMREVDDKADVDNDQFASNIGFLFGLFCRISNMQIHPQEGDQKEPPSVEPKQLL